MKLQKRMYKGVVALLLAINLMILPVLAADESIAYVEPRFNNIATVALTIGFDANNVAYCEVSLNPYSHCTGFDGMMRLYDSNGTQLKSWAVSDYVSPYGVEKTWQCEEGKTYTVTFQGYAYGTGSMYDEINLSVTDTCEQQ